MHISLATKVALFTATALVTFSFNANACQFCAAAALKNGGPEFRKPTGVAANLTRPSGGGGQSSGATAGFASRAPSFTPANEYFKETADEVEPTDPSRGKNRDASKSNITIVNGMY